MNDSSNIEPRLYDLAVVGGGINGVGIAADAAGRGLSVFLCERDDLASHTSSASSKLIHGGLRYLEHHEFRLVREALAEREVLLEMAPHIVKPMRFVLPHRPHLRPAWLIRAALLLYDNLGKREKLPPSRSVRFAADSPLKPQIRRGFEYSDCWVDDARLVIVNAMAARERGAEIHTRTRCLSARRLDGHWQLELQGPDGRAFSIRARALVNAAGPWVAAFIANNLHLHAPHGIRLIKGGHVIVPQLYPGEQAYILQNEDRRIVFAIPYLGRFTMIGTTDSEYRGDPARVRIDVEEVDYLLGVANAHFRHQLSAADVVHSFAGVRPLCDDEADNPSAITRDYTLSLDAPPGEAPLLSVFGGKLTTYRKLAEAALSQLKPYFAQMDASWTAHSHLPGGEQMTTPQALASELLARVEGLEPALAQRWASTYGSRSWRMLGAARTLAELGEDLGQGLLEAEADYLCREEWAIDADDILWRRSKLGLAFSAADRARLQGWLRQRTPSGASAVSAPRSAAQAPGQTAGDPLHGI